MDWNAIQQYLPLYQKAAVLTVRLGVAGIIFAIIIGLACAVIQYDKVPVLRQIVGVYIQLSRNTPLWKAGHQLGLKIAVDLFL